LSKRRDGELCRLDTDATIYEETIAAQEAATVLIWPLCHIMYNGQDKIKVTKQ